MAYRRGHYIPSNTAQFRVFAHKLISYVQEKTFGGADAPWKDAIPRARFDALAASFALFTQAQDLAFSVPTHANINRRQEAQKETTAVIRAFVNQFLRFPPVTDADRIEMGIPNHDTIRTDHTIVTEIVDFAIHLHVIRELNVDFWIKGSESKAKPDGYDGALIVWGILDAPPKNHDDLTHHRMASKTPYSIPFNETDRGRTVYISLCWQNERGILGAWSEIKSAIVP
jgi:hypothetical protein